jgi:hypothetical protein
MLWASQWFFGLMHSFLFEISTVFDFALHFMDAIRLKIHFRFIELFSANDINLHNLIINRVYNSIMQICEHENVSGKRSIFNFHHIFRLINFLALTKNFVSWELNQYFTFWEISLTSQGLKFQKNQEPEKIISIL